MKVKSVELFIAKQLSAGKLESVSQVQILAEAIWVRLPLILFEKGWIHLLLIHLWTRTD